MSKRLYDEEFNYEQRNFKKTKINKINTNYIKISINDSLFYQYSLNELNEFSNEILNVINKLQLHKERIDSVLAIYT
tara:strand:+ start:249 stop:479 length:231 start_codon:yes stop_codon:yes gene_type:complete